MTSPEAGDLEVERLARVISDGTRPPNMELARWLIDNGYAKRDALVEEKAAIAEEFFALLSPAYLNHELDAWPGSLVQDLLNCMHRYDECAVAIRAAASGTRPSHLGY